MLSYDDLSDSFQQLVETGGTGKPTRTAADHTPRRDRLLLMEITQEKQSEPYSSSVEKKASVAKKKPIVSSSRYC